MIAIVVIGCLCSWLILSAIIGPLLGALMAGRPMSRGEVDTVTWGGLGLFMGLFLLALLTIGARP